MRACPECSLWGPDRNWPRIGRPEPIYARNTSNRRGVPVYLFSPCCAWAERKMEGIKFLPIDEIKDAWNDVRETTDKREVLDALDARERLLEGPK